MSDDGLREAKGSFKDQESRKESSTGGVSLYLCRALVRQMIPPVLLPREFRQKSTQLTKAKRRKEWREPDAKERKEP